MTEDAATLRARATALRREQRMIEADSAIARAAALDPTDRLTAFLHAQSRYELGYPAADLFAHALKLWPDNPDILRNHALALASQGFADRAASILAEALQARPDWLDGHRVLASLRWSGGDEKHFDASYALALRAQPGNAALWLAWFAAVAQTRDWHRSLAILGDAARALGSTDPLVVAEAFVAAESGDDARAGELFSRLAGRKDDTLDLALIRFHLRAGEPEAAQEIAVALLSGRAAGQVWPYLSTIWRLLGDPRAAWLDGDPVFAAQLDVGLTHSELDCLAELLRGLHTAQRPYVEQSVRGGTQTDRSVLLRHEPTLRHTREALLEAVRSFAAALPPPDPRHPLLSRPRDALLIAGSWSVRLQGDGYNVTHSHPMGWLSAAFYVSAPKAADMGAAPAGHLTIGAPPPELRLDLPPYLTMAPKVGTVAVFASTLWHATVPFAAGERLNIAFDVIPAPR